MYKKIPKAMKNLQENYILGCTRVSLHELAVTHDVSDKQVKDIFGLKMYYHREHRVQCICIVHVKSKELNEGRPSGDKYSLEDIQNIIDSDPAYKQLSAKEEQYYINQLNEYRALKMSGACANNVSAARDAVAVMDRISKELHALRDRAGHVNDQVQLTWIVTDNVHEFWEDQMSLALDDVACQFEEWVCNQKKTDVSLGRATGKMDLQMNYQNYEKAIVLVYGVKLDGWPEGLPFIAPSHMHTILEVRTLRDALVTGACHWKKLTQRELEDLHMDIQRRSDAGEVIGMVRKKCSDTGKTHKCKAPAAEGATDGTMAKGDSKRTQKSRRGQAA
ncbi:hypothetical protein DFJ58DRAFT_837119 [Suillus subalutaceus]|uniref:uncharacterized protein n=1 Tax=Suillus subalutaceus TaxID=48586 RepID=UPI001B886939|nr:uncharacterized protein DFJ58DRAFT_837119 [Suillus subalutaceus]KAG1871805.1 hypothetical protein DFJ58DRAFT_837119 [Suillus subalutaceus]